MSAAAARHTVVILDASGATTSRLGRWLARKSDALRIARLWARSGSAGVVLVTVGADGTTQTPITA